MPDRKTAFPKHLLDIKGENRIVAYNENVFLSPMRLCKCIYSLRHHHRFFTQTGSNCPWIQCEAKREIVNENQWLAAIILCILLRVGELRNALIFIIMCAMSIMGLLLNTLSILIYR